MNALQISVSGLILLVGATAVGMAALRSPSAEFANGLLTLCGASLLFALIAIKYRLGNRRAFWLGFSVFGWAYLLASYGPFVGSTMRARLLTTTLIDRLYARMNPALEDTPQEIATRNPDWVQQKYQWHIRFDQETDPNADSVAVTAVGYRPTTENLISFYPPATCSNLVWFRNCAHALATLWIAFFGGLIGRYLEATSRVVSLPPLSRRSPDRENG
jgi:hypothetical protein